MSYSWIQNTAKLKQGILLLNALNKVQFRELLNQITTNNLNILPETQMKIISADLNLDLQKIELIIKTIIHIFKQSSKIIIKPTVLQEQLVEELKLNVENADEFVKYWTDDTKKYFDIENAHNVEKISWELNVESCSKFNNKEKFVNARLQMATVSVDKKENGIITLELDEGELKQLYSTLENIQNKLDIM